MKKLAIAFMILSSGPAYAEPTVTLTQSELMLVIDAQVAAYAAQQAATRATAVTKRINDASLDRYGSAHL